MSLLTDLIAVRDLLSPEGAWTQGAYARSRAGTPVDPHGRAAVCWCLAGAAARACSPTRPKAGQSERRLAVCRSINRAVRYRATLGIANWNDVRRRTQADVIAMLDRAIEAAK